MSMGNRATLVWLLLIAMTILSVIVGDFSEGGRDIVIFVLSLIFLKGQLIVEFFMGMWEVKLRWRLILTAYLVMVVGLIATSYLLT